MNKTNNTRFLFLKEMFNHPVVAPIVSGLIILFATYTIQSLSVQSLQVRILQEILIGDTNYTSIQVANPNITKERSLTIVVPSDIGEEEIFSNYPVEVELKKTNNEGETLFVLNNIPARKEVTIYLETQKKLTLYDSKGEKVNLIEENEYNLWSMTVLMYTAITVAAYSVVFLFDLVIRKGLVNGLHREIEEAKNSYKGAVEELEKVEKKHAEIEKKLEKIEEETILYKGESLLWAAVIRNFFDKLAVSRMDVTEFFKIVRNLVKDADPKTVGADIELGILEKKSQKRKG